MLFGDKRWYLWVVCSSVLSMLGPDSYQLLLPYYSNVLLRRDDKEDQTG